MDVESPEEKLKRYREELEEVVAAAAQREASEEPDYRLDLEAAAAAAAAEARAAPSSSSPEEEEVEAAAGSSSATTTLTQSGAVGDTGDLLPEAVVPLVARAAQGSRLPLKEAAEEASAVARSALGPASKFTPLVTPEKVAAKLRLIAERKAYGERPKACVASEDAAPRAAWRWEVQSLELFEQSAGSKVREARAARAKVGKRIKALAKLCEVLVKHGTDRAKVSQEEEKVAKFKREDEAARQKLIALQKKKREKAETEATKRKRKEDDEARKKKKKDDDEAKKKAAEEADRKKAAAAARQRGLMHAFVATTHPSSNKPSSQRSSPAGTASSASLSQRTPKGGGAPTDTSVSKTSTTRADDDATSVNRTLFGQQTTAKNEAFDLLAAQRAEPVTADEIAATLRAARRRQLAAKHEEARREAADDDDVVLLDDARADGDAMDRPQEEEASAAPKFFCFHHEYRGARWDRSGRVSTVVTGTTPFAKDPAVDYDYDSDADFAANDAEVEDGEDLEEEEGEEDLQDDDEDDEDELDYDDGFLAADGGAGDPGDDASSPTHAGGAKAADVAPSSLPATRLLVLGPFHAPSFDRGLLLPDDESLGEAVNDAAAAWEAGLPEALRAYRARLFFDPATEAVKAKAKVAEAKAKAVEAKAKAAAAKAAATKPTKPTTTRTDHGAPADAKPKKQQTAKKADKLGAAGAKGQKKLTNFFAKPKKAAAKPASSD